jgi:hypothetical protein
MNLNKIILTPKVETHGKYLFFLDGLGKGDCKQSSQAL